MCALAQIIGGGFSAGEGKLKATPGWGSRHDASFLSALRLKLQTHCRCRSANESSLSGRARGFWHTQTLTPPPSPALPINLLYPGLNMSRVDVTLRLCRGQTEEERGPVEVKCSGVRDSGDTGRRKRGACVLGEIEGGRRRGDGVQLKDHPMRGDLKAGVRLYEFGPPCHMCAYWQSYAHGPSHTGGEPQTEAHLIQTAHVSVFKDPRDSSQRGAQE